MDSTSALVLVSLTMIGLGCGIAILTASKKLPPEPESFQKTGRIAAILPGMNCGACGRPGCFAYAQALVEDPQTINRTPCMTALKNKACVAALEAELGVKLESEGMDRKAVVHCVGMSPPLFEYRGVQTCKAAAQLSGGFKACPYGCLGLGDCARACPSNAIGIDAERGVAVVDPAKCIGCGKCVAECPHMLIELIPAGQPQFLGCAYTSLKDIPGRGKCKQGCIKCRKCVKASPGGEVAWNDGRNLPNIGVASAQAAVQECPVKVIVPHSNK